MNIKAQSIHHRFGREPVFKNLSLEFIGPKKTAILGGNGSGKSTLLLILSGALTPTHGEVTYDLSGESLTKENLFKQVGFTSPAMDLIEAFYPQEMISFYAKLKPLQISNEEVLNRVDLHKQKHKPISKFSSGMKQRLKLGLAMYSKAPFLFLDEPCSNLDAHYIQWYQNEMETFAKDKMVFIGSNNQQDEYFCCPETVKTSDFK